MINDLRHSVGAAIFHKVAGPEGPQRRERFHGREGERWFATGSPIQVVHGDASMFVGGLRALMFQALHPVAMTAVAEHSGYRGDMWGRLARTSTFLAATTFATAQDAQASVDAVRRIHDSITGTMPDGTPYSASDPHLLLWVHVAEIDSFLRAHDRYGKDRLDPAGRDEYVAQTATVAERLGVVEAPRTVAELTEVLESYRPELRGTDHAHEAISHLVWHPDLPLAVRPAYLAIAAAAIAMMPGWTRRELRLPRLPVTERALARPLGALATRTIRWAMTPPDSGAASPAAHP